MRVKKTATSELIEENLGLVRFVPLIGTKGVERTKQHELTVNERFR